MKTTKRVRSTSAVEITDSAKGVVFLQSYATIVAAAWFDSKGRCHSVVRHTAATFVGPGFWSKTTARQVGEFVAKYSKDGAAICGITGEAVETPGSMLD